jgi:hypothetical protein
VHEINNSKVKKVASSHLSSITWVRTARGETLAASGKTHYITAFGNFGCLVLIWGNAVA